MDNKMKTKQMVMCGLGIAVIFLMTVFVVVPMPSMGYVNVGDTGIMFFASFLNPVYAFIVGGVGSALGDLYLGYSQYAVFTIIIKGVEALVIAIIFKRLKGYAKYSAYFIGILIMVVGYYFTDVIFLGNFIAALPGVVGNIIQGGVSLIVAIVAQAAFNKIISNNENLYRSY